MKKTFIGLAVLAVTTLAMTSCSKDEEPVDEAVTVYIGTLKSNISWTANEKIKTAWSYLPSDFVDELNKVGYFVNGTDLFFSYEVETTKSKKDAVTEEYTKKFIEYYTEVLNKIETYDFSARLTTEQKNQAYGFHYNVTASCVGMDLSIHLSVCNPQLVKGLTYATDDASAEIKSFTIDNGVLNHFNEKKTATVTYANGTTKTLAVSEYGGCFFLGDDADHGFVYGGTDNLDTSTLAYGDNKIPYKLKQ